MLFKNKKDNYMINHDLLYLLEQVLGKSKKSSGNNYSFYSPFVNHHKPKLDIDLSIDKPTNLWHCWISNTSGRGIYSLFKKIRVSNEYFKKLSKILGDRNLLISSSNVKPTNDVIRLPDEFIPLYDVKKTSDARLKYEMIYAMQYLKNRKINSYDIMRYNIGYCSTGVYSGRIIVPSYDANSNLNYFDSRTIYDDVSGKYKKPPFSKNVVGFESMINWNLPITLVEGVFDAITARFNVIPLFGKTVQSVLAERIVLRRPPEINVCLDNDANLSSIKICSYFISNGIRCRMIKLPGKDINEIGFNQFIETKNRTKFINEFDLLKERIFI
ncbi:DNA primase-like protein [Microcystis phage Mel-JY01]